MTNLVFFGAGASEPFGIPTMQEMVDGFEEEIEGDKSLSDFYSKIKKKLIKGYMEPKIDIESMLSVIKGIAADTKPYELGHFAFYYISDDGSNGKFSPSEIDLGGKLQEKLQEYIKKTCKTSKSKEDADEVYRRSYLPLFKYMTKDSRDRNYDDNLTRNWKAYTTNYDDICESFLRIFEGLTDHFRKEDGSENHYFSTEPLQDTQTFCKLHGSLNWATDIEKRRILKSHSGFELSKTEGNVMLFPIQQKDLYLHPWFTLFQDLKSGLSQKDNLYAIGYAFNDEFIRNAFQEALAENSDKNLVIINPNAVQIREKFPEFIRNQIDVLPIEFDSEFFAQQFQDQVEKVKTIVIKFYIKNHLEKTQDSTLSIQSNHIIKSSKIFTDYEGVIKESDVHTIHINGKQITHYPKARESMSERGNKHVYFTTSSSNNIEIELELKISYAYCDEIELQISYNTEELDCGIYYCSVMIDRYKSIEKGHIVKKDKKWTKEPINLDKTKLKPQPCEY